MSEELPEHNKLPNAVDRAANLSAGKGRLEADRTPHGARDYSQHVNGAATLI